MHVINFLIFKSPTGAEEVKLQLNYLNFSQTVVAVYMLLWRCTSAVELWVKVTYQSLKTTSLAHQAISLNTLKKNLVKKYHFHKVRSPTSA